MTKYSENGDPDREREVKKVIVCDLGEKCSVESETGEIFIDYRCITE